MLPHPCSRVLVLCYIICVTEQKISQQHGQCKYNVTSRRGRVTIVAVEKQ